MGEAPARKALIAIVAHNTKRHWPRLRAALEAQSERGFRLLVVDNASNSEERLAASDMPAFGELVQLETNVGFAAANNLAFTHCAEPYFVCLNPDAFPEPDWLQRLIAAAEAAPEAGAIGSLQVAADDPHVLDGAGDVYWACGIPYRALHGRERPDAIKPGETFSACAAAALYRQEAFRVAAGFDESFFCYCEDVDLGFRLRLLGWRVMQADDAIVAHVGGGSIGARSRFALFHGARNRVWTFAKNVPAPLIWALTPLHVLVTLMIVIASLPSGAGEPTRAGLFSALRHLPRVLKQRRAIQATRRISNIEIARAMAWSPLALIARSAVRR